MTPATPRWSAAAYGLMAWPLAWMALPMHLQLGHFLTVTQGLALEEVGLLILLVRALEWIQDLALGLVMERAWHSRWVGALAAGATALLALGFAGLSLGLGAPAIGLALGARMLFAAILLLAVRPWLTPRA